MEEVSYYRNICLLHVVSWKYPLLYYAGIASSSNVKTLFISSSILTFPFIFPIPRIMSVLMSLPRDGVGSISLAVMSRTSDTVSTIIPINLVLMSTTIMHVSFVYPISGIMNFNLRSTTGMTLPLRFICSHSISPFHLKIPHVQAGQCKLLLLCHNLRQ